LILAAAVPSLRLFFGHWRRNIRSRNAFPLKINGNQSFHSWQEQELLSSDIKSKEFETIVARLVTFRPGIEQAPAECALHKSSCFIKLSGCTACFDYPTDCIHIRGAIHVFVFPFRPLHRELFKNVSGGAINHRQLLYILKQNNIIIEEADSSQDSRLAHVGSGSISGARSVVCPH
jgi:hypothetical protein